MTYSQPRSVSSRDAVVVAGLILALLACGGGVVLISLLSQRKTVAATPAPLPTPEQPTPAPAELVFETLPTPTSPAPTVVSVVVSSPTRAAGESCTYSEAWINEIATPIPDGEYSAYQDYLCDNGYWDIGIGDWVDRSGNWGEDGTLEKALIKYDKDGIEIDRMYFDLNGNRIPGP